MACLPDDNSRKVMEQLINKLQNETKSPKMEQKRDSQKGAVSKSKLHSSPKGAANKTPSKSNKKFRKQSGSRKITEWLSKDKLVKKRQGIPQDDIYNKRSECVPEKKNSSKKLTKTPEKKSSKSKLPRSRSFEQYGLVMPSYKDILEQQKKYDEHKKIVAAFDEIEDVDLDLPTSIDNIDSQEESEMQLLDCKHLSTEEIQKAFESNLNYIKDISDGKKYSLRHNRYNQYKSEYTKTTKDLTYNTSMIVFTDDQKLHLISLMEQALDPDNKNTKYFFQVLLPELCLKIFMDVHDMSKRKANKYLDRRPVI